MRVAICLSGELRYFNNELVHRGFETFIQKHNPDIFVSTWDHVGISMNHQYINPFDQKEVQLQLEDETKQVYKSLKGVRMENYNNWVSNVDEEISGILKDPSYDYRTVNSFAQLYKLYQANELKAQYEATHGFKYDVVIRSRPDNLFVDDLKLHEIEPNTIYNINFQGNFYPNRIYDILFYGDSASMDVVSTSYLHFKELLRNSFNNGLCSRDACRLSPVTLALRAV